MERIERKLDQHGMTEREASLKAVGKPDLIRDMKRRRGLAGSERMERLATLLGTSSTWLLYGGMEGPILDRDSLNPDGTVKTEVRGTRMSAEDVREAWISPQPHKPVPLLGSAFGGEWEDEIEMTELHLAEVLDYLGRPPSMQTDPDAYCVEIVGESMSPRFEPGERAYVSPRSAVSIGADVIVQLKGAGEEDLADRVVMVLIKRLVKRSPKFIELRQFNPDMTFRVPIERVAAVHRVKGRL